MDQDPDSSPLDDLRHYAYEGDGKLVVPVPVPVVADITTLEYEGKKIAVYNSSS